jgi:NAD(P)-dependent dehydrogenase (short-subunit alcohol dehydrogenase family)
MVETEGVRAAGFDQGDLRKSVEAQTPLGRIGQPEDIAPAVVLSRLRPIPRGSQAKRCVSRAVFADETGKIENA